MSAIFINVFGIAIIIIPLIILSSRSKNISFRLMRPVDEERPHFYINVWFFQSARRQIMEGKTYQPGKVVGSNKGGHYAVESVTCLKGMMGLRKHYELRMKRLPATAAETIG